MSNVVKDINTENYTYYLFDDIINIKDFDPNNIKINEKLYKNIFFTILHMSRSKIQNKEKLIV